MKVYVRRDKEEAIQKIEELLEGQPYEKLESITFPGNLVYDMPGMVDIKLSVECMAAGASSVSTTE